MTSALDPSVLNARGKAQAHWHYQAHEARKSIWGRQTFIRGVVEVSNYCRQNCSYCGMRRDNDTLDRYRITLDVLREIILDARPASITDINFQAGEDPIAVREIIIPLIQEIRQNTSLGISVCLGTLDAHLYQALHEAGAELYIIKLETGNADHYREVKAPGTLAKRLQAIQTLVNQGWLVSSGYIHGLPGQSFAHILETLDLLASLPIHGNSVSPFIPGSDTLYKNAPPASLEETLNALAAMRLAHPRRVIPAVSAMNILHPDGYQRALRAGANLTTINLTPPDWRDHYLLYKKNRFIMSETRVLRAIEAADLEPSSVSLATSLRKVYADIATAPLVSSP